MGEMALNRSGMLVLAAICVWIVGTPVSFGIAAITEDSNPVWSSQPAPDCYIGLQTVLLAIFLSYLIFAVIGGAVFISGILIAEKRP